MERETNQDQNPPIKLNQSPRKPPPSGGGGGGSGSDRLKRDEWSEGAVGSLLEAYESKWILRNRAKLKGQDWEDVARHVSSRANSSKSPKTQTQCKNKIESMKKRYRSESAANDTSSWPLFSRLDHLLRGTGSSGGPLPAHPPPLPPPPTAVQPPAALKGATVESNQGLLLLESSTVAQQLLPPQAPPPPLPEPPLPPPQPAVEIAENSQESNGVDHTAKESEGGAAKLSDQKQQDQAETDSSTPALYSNDRNDLKPNKMKMKMKMKVKRKRARREDGGWDDVAESVRWLAEAVVRSEQARMDTIREVERMRVEAEAKRGELDLKRTEIIASTQLEIARIFASALAGKGVDSSLRIGRS